LCVGWLSRVRESSELASLYTLDLEQTDQTS